MFTILLERDRFMKYGSPAVADPLMMYLWHSSAKYKTRRLEFRSARPLRASSVLWKSSLQAVPNRRPTCSYWSPGTNPMILPAWGTSSNEKVDGWQKVSAKLGSCKNISKAPEMVDLMTLAVLPSATIFCHSSRKNSPRSSSGPVSYTHLRAHETGR